MNIIDLRSDTVTRPSPAMLEYMMKADVGDDVLGDDPTVMELERKLSGMFGMDEAVFCPSGTMTNQIAIKVHTRPGDEVLCDITSHAYNFEGGGIGFNSGCSVRLINGDRGLMKAFQVEENINPGDVHYARSKLVIAENTSNKGGGSIYPFQDLAEIAGVCKKHKLFFHLDGARLFNALVETGEKPADFGRLFDSISICFSKGLGAPVGSVLIGSSPFIDEARRVRKIFGGGMRQSGYLAAAAIYAIDHNISKLSEDNRRAKELGKTLEKLSYVTDVQTVQTNIVIFTLTGKSPQADFLRKLKEKGIHAMGFGPQKIRFVTHLDFTDEMLDHTLEVLASLS